MSDAIELPPALAEVYGGDAFTREDESDDRAFYARDRMVDHLDRRALAAVASVIDALVTEDEPAVLDLMASRDSHLPARLHGASVHGLGLNESELRANPVLDGHVVHDLNADPRLPYPDATFDVVLNVVSVDYLTRPFEIFREVGRVLRPGGLVLVVFSDRMFPGKAVRIWRRAEEKERYLIVEDYVRESGLFEEPRRFACIGRPRPRDDRYADVEPQSDPVHAVFAERKGGDPARPRRPDPVVEWPAPWGEDEVRRRRAGTRETLACPHCGVPLTPWEPPDGPFAEWDAPLEHVCFNDRCPHYVRGWDAMARQGNLGYSVRLVYTQSRDAFRSLPVSGPGALREGIRESGGKPV